MAETVEAGTRNDKARPEPRGLVSDCRLMLSFARKNGFVLPPTLLHEIAWLDSVLKALDIASVSQMASQLIWPLDLSSGQPVYLPCDVVAERPAPADAAAAPGSPSRAVPGMAPEEVILDVHSQLSLLIAPTTALSLQTSEPPAGQRHIFGSMPPLVQYVIVVAFISAICFAISATQIASRKHTPAARQAREAREARAIAAPPPPAAFASTSASQPSAPAGADAASAANPGSDTPAAAPPATRRAPARASRPTGGVKP